MSLVSAALVWAAFSLGPTAAATTLVVNAADDVDDGVCDAAHCSLREAINAANAAPGVDNITFNIPGAAPHTIHLGTALPTITSPVIIDGTTQPGFESCDVGPVIELDGSGMAGSVRDGLAITGGSSTVRGLVINGFAFSGRGIFIETNGGNTIECNRIGTDVAGMTARPNGNGVVLYSSGNLIGGTTASARNLISGNGATAIWVNGSANTIAGNFIGTNATGNGLLTGRPASAFLGIFVNGADNTVIGGGTLGAGNVISGNGGAGIYISGQGTLVYGNAIGVSADGTVAVPNAGDGVSLGEGGSGGNRIGGTFAGGGAGNVISGNTGFGVHISGAGNCCSTTVANFVQGNRIGTNPSGTVLLGNGSGGILLEAATFGSRNTLIGGTSSGERNIIAFNSGPGVAIVGAASAGNRILGNSIFSNDGLGIDLGHDGVTPNDTGDADSGPNNLQNFPVLTDMNSGGASTTVVGTLNSASLTTFRVEFFTNGTCDATGYGEGGSFLGATATVTDAGGNASFSASFASTVAAGRSATATATDPAGNTSEFSLCRAVTSTVNGPPATLTLSPATATNTAGTQHCVTATVTDAFGNPVSGVSVVFSVSGTNSAGPTTKTTDASGQAQFCYTGTKAGEDAIRAFADTNGNGSQNAGEPTGAATKTYVAAAPATLVLSPHNATNTVGTQHCVTATVTDAFGNPTPNQTVGFLSSFQTSPFRTFKTTDANGQATFCYQGPELGPSGDFITALVDSNNNNERDAGEPFDVAFKQWVLPVSTPLCTVTITDGSRITANNGDKATFSGNAKVSASGSLSGQEDYQDRGPAFFIKFHSITILAVTCSADKKQASIYGSGQVTIGSGKFGVLFKIDVKDLADPGVGKDTYRILLDYRLYDSGEHTLEGGNIQIRIR